MTEHYGAPMTMPMGTDCAVHKHREWVPIESHHIRPVGMGGPNVKANRVNVCANAHYSIHEYIQQLINTGGKVPPETARHFSPTVRAYAVRGWTEAGSPTTGSGN